MDISFWFVFDGQVVTLNDLLKQVAIAMHFAFGYCLSVPDGNFNDPPPLIIVQYSFELKFHDRIST